MNAINYPFGTALIDLRVLSPEAMNDHSSCSSIYAGVCE